MSMYVLAGDRWENGFPDYYRAPGEYRIAVTCFINLAKIQGIYPTYERDWRRVITYAKEFGIKPLIRKIRSRTKEGLRNQKFLSCGVGYIIEGDSPSLLQIGQPVLFIAPCHPQCVQRVVLPRELLKPCEESPINNLPENHGILYMDATQNQDLPDIFNQIIGWSPYSGQTLEKNAVGLGFQQVAHLLGQVDWSKSQKLITRSDEINERLAPASNNVVPAKLQAAIFGYGHYAKSVIIPNINPNIAIAKIHEIDPCQIGSRNGFPFAIDTAPIPREDERYDVYFAAGYHHTHAAVATHALRQGGSAVLEKPLVTTWEQLKALLEAMEHGGGRLFVGFTRRYLPFNEYIKSDLNVQANKPIFYHCIVQMPRLQALHWYRWPNSCSQIISNGCHWIDHFLYLNQWPAITYFDAFEMSNGDIICMAELANGANFSMALTTLGSTRLGYREIITLRSDDVTIYIHDLSRYQSESSRKIIRKAKITRTSIYDTMYRAISHKIVMDQPGESKRSVELSAGLMLHLEDRLRQNKFKTSASLAANPGKKMLAVP